MRIATIGIVCLVLASVGRAENGCSFPANLDGFIPFFLDCSTGTHYIIVNNTLHIPSGKTLTTSCTLNYNFCKNSNIPVESTGSSQEYFEDGIDSSEAENTEQGKARQEYTCDSHIGYNGYTTRRPRIQILPCDNSKYYGVHLSNKTTNNCRGQFVTIGYYFGLRSHVDILEICYDQKLNQPLYMHHKITKTAFDDQILEPFLKIRNDTSGDTVNIFDNNVENWEYLKFSSEYFRSFSWWPSSTEHFLIESALVKEDFPFVLQDIVQIKMTQWVISKELANHNWKYLTNDIRSLTFGENTRPLHIYTGTSGILQLPFKSGLLSDVYLVNVPMYKKEAPVPEYLWKIVHDEVAGKAVAIVGYNSPVLRIDDVQEKIFCTDICNSLKWLNELKNKHTVLSLGLVFCCSLEEFDKKVDRIPALKNVTLLLTE